MFNRYIHSQARGSAVACASNHPANAGTSLSIALINNQENTAHRPETSDSRFRGWPRRIVLGLTAWVLALTPLDGVGRGQEALEIGPASAQDTAKGPQAAIVDQQNRPAQIIKSVAPNYPFSLQMHGVEGYAVVYYLISEEGRAFDFVTFAASRPEFGRATIRALMRSRFSPGLVEGRPSVTRSLSRRTFTLDQSDGPGLRYLTDGKQRPSYRSSFLDETEEGYQVSEMNELDAPPRAIEVVTPEYPKSMIEHETGGQVLVELFIDPEGYVHAPGIKSATNDIFALAALGAIRQWVFDPPLKSGKAVWVRAYQPFLFEYPVVDFESGLLFPAIEGALSLRE